MTTPTDESARMIDEIARLSGLLGRNKRIQRRLDEAVKALKAIHDCREDVPERYVAVVDAIACEAITNIEEEGGDE